MIEKLAKFRVLQPRRLAMGSQHLAPANDNRRSARQPDAARRRTQALVCRWSVEDGRLACHWEIDGPHGVAPTQPGSPGVAGAFHTPVVVLSYQRRRRPLVRSHGGCRTRARTRCACCAHITHRSQS